MSAVAGTRIRIEVLSGHEPAYRWSCNGCGRVQRDSQLYPSRHAASTAARLYHPTCGSVW